MIGFGYFGSGYASSTQLLSDRPSTPGGHCWYGYMAAIGNPSVLVFFHTS